MAYFSFGDSEVSEGDQQRSIVGWDPDLTYDTSSAALWAGELDLVRTVLVVR